MANRRIAAACALWAASVVAGIATPALAQQPTPGPTQSLRKVQVLGVDLPFEPIVNLGAGLTAVDNAGAKRTDLSLPNVGPGAGTIGGGSNFINSITLDAQGRVAAVATGVVGGTLSGLTVGHVPVATGASALGDSGMTWSGSTLTASGGSLGSSGTPWSSASITSTATNSVDALSSVSLNLGLTSAANIQLGNPATYAQFRSGTVVMGETSATSGTTLVNSSLLDLRGAYWNSTSSVNADAVLENIVDSVTPTMHLSVSFGAGEKFQLTSAGNLLLASGGDIDTITSSGTLNIGGGNTATLNIGNSSTTVWLAGGSSGTGSARTVNAFYSVAPTSATSGTQKVNSPVRYWQGNYWTGTAANGYFAGMYFSMDTTTPSGHLSFSFGTPSISEVAQVTSGGYFKALAGGGLDTIAAGTLHVGDSTANSIIVGGANVPVYLNNQSVGSGYTMTFNSLYLSAVAATSGAQLQSSPQLYLRTNYWNGTASTNYDMTILGIADSVTPTAHIGMRFAGTEAFQFTNANELWAKSGSAGALVRIDNDVNISNAVGLTLRNNAGTIAINDPPALEFYGNGRDDAGTTSYPTSTILKTTSRGDTVPQTVTLQLFSQFNGGTQWEALDVTTEENTGKVDITSSHSMSLGASGLAQITDLTVGPFNRSGLTASTEASAVVFGTTASAMHYSWAAGALATQRHYFFRRPTYDFAAASTATNVATVAIEGAPIAGSNATITNDYALWVESGLARFDGGIQFSDGTTQTTAGGGASTGNWTFSGNNADLTAAGAMGIGLNTASSISMGNTTVSGITFLAQDGIGGFNFKAGNNATSGTTLVNTPVLNLGARYWNGTSSVLWQAGLYHVMESTTPTSHISVLFNGTEKQRFSSNGNFSLSAGATIGNLSAGATNTTGLTIAPNIADGSSSIGLLVAPGTGLPTGVGFQVTVASTPTTGSIAKFTDGTHDVEIGVQASSYPRISTTQSNLGFFNTSLTGLVAAGTTELDYYINGSNNLKLTSSALTLITSGGLTLGDISHAWSNTFSTIFTAVDNAIGTGSTTFGVSAQNTTAATSGTTQQYSPIVEETGAAWNTSVTVPWKFGLQLQPQSAASTSAIEKFGFSVAGSSYTWEATLDSSGNFLTAGSLNTQAGFVGHVTSSGSAITLTCTNTYPSTYIVAATSSSSQTVNLPKVSTCAAGTTFIIQKTASGSNTISLTANGTDVINGATTQTITSGFGGRVIWSDGISNWYIAGSN